MSGNQQPTILAIGAHADDAYIGAGGVLLQAVRAGCRVVIITAVSDFSNRLRTRGQEQATLDEARALSEQYGFEQHFLGLPYHQVNAADMDLKKRISAIAADVRPDVTLIHHDQDYWPDHVACAKLGFDAVMFTHGLTDDLTQSYCPLVLAYDATPRQTITFTPDVFYDVTDVMPDYMELILKIDSILNRVSAESLVQAQFAMTAPPSAPMRLSAHGKLRLADCLRHGDLGGCPFGQGFRTVWGDKRGPSLWPGHQSQ